MTQARTFDYRDFVYPPAAQAVAWKDWAERIHTTPGVPFGVPVVDKRMIPLHPGDVAAVVGRPGHGKSSLLSFQARAEAKRIVERGTQDTECVVYVTWEQVIEELRNILGISGQFTPSDVAWGRADMQAVIEQSIHGVQLPVWMIGHSLARADIRMPRMTTEVVFRAIERMKEDYGKTPTLLCMDYIQIVPIDVVADRVTQVSEAIIRVKELAMRVGCPVWLGAQAGRQVDIRNIKIPQPGDVQWSSAVEQTVDKYFGVWRPWLTEPRDTPIKINGEMIDVTQELLILEMSKQRFEQAGFMWPLHFAPQYLKLCEYELRQAPPEEVPGYDW